MIKSLPILTAFLISMLGAACAKTPDPRAFVDSWTAAVAKKDAKGVWNLLDKDAQKKALDAFQKSKDRSSTDMDFKDLFAGINPALALSQSPQEMAIHSIGRQLGAAFDPTVEVKPNGDEALLSGQGKSVRLHLEDGQWKAASGAIGFVFADGSIATLAWGWPVPRLTEGSRAAAGPALKPGPNRDANGEDQGQMVSSSYFETKDGVRRAILEVPDGEQPSVTTVRTQKDSKGADIATLTEEQLDDVVATNRLVPDALVGFHVHIDINGLSADDLRIGFAQIAGRISKLANFREEFSDQAAKIMLYYESALGADGPDDKTRPYDFEFNVGNDGGLTVTELTYNRASRSKDKKVHPLLRFGELPPAP